MAHTDLFLKCLETLMQNGLRRNNCNFEHDTSPIDDISCHQIEKQLPAFNAYACEYWVQHFHDSDYHNETLDIREERHQLISTFLSKHLLHWIEAMSLLRKSFRTISSLSLLESIIISNDELYDLVHDAKRFLLAHRSFVELYPLQIYSSALLFSPENSLVRRKFKDAVPGWITLRATMRLNWSPLLHTLDHGNDPICSITMSRESNNLLSLSSAYDFTIRIWDLSTGECLKKSEYKSPVDFSSDLQKLLEFSDKKVVVRSVSTSEVLQEIEVDIGNHHYGVFSADSKSIAFQSLDGVKVWDTESGHVKTIFRPLGKLDQLWFSHDASTLVTVNKSTCTIEIWVTQTGECLQTLHQDGDIGHIFVSHDLKKLVSAPAYYGVHNDIKIWDIQTGTCLRAIDTETNNHVAFSPDSRRLFSGYGNIFRYSTMSERFIKVWDVGSGKCLKTIWCGMGNDWASAIFYDNCQKLVTQSRESVEIWDLSIRTSETNSAEHAHEGALSLISISDNSGKLVSGSETNKNVKIWDTTTGRCLHTLENQNSQRIRLATFSHDSLKLASVSEDNNIKIWDVATGKCQMTLISHEGTEKGYNLLVFSKCSTMLASASCSTNQYLPNWTSLLKVWDTTDGSCLQILKPKDYVVCSVVFPFQDRPSMVAAYFMSVEIWDISTGERLYQQEAKDNGFTQPLLQLSHDSHKIAIAVGCGLQIRNWKTGTSLQIPDAHSNTIHGIAISNNSSMVASGDQSHIKVWDISVSSGPKEKNCPVCLHTFPSAWSLSRISFSINDQELLTNFGPIALRSSPLRSTSSTSTRKNVSTQEALHVESPQALYRYCICECDIDDKGYWITCNNKNVLRLPFEYRPAEPGYMFYPPNFFIKESIIAIGSLSGNVIIIEFSSEKLRQTGVLQDLDSFNADNLLL
ncbi:Quino protein amine dehydrogenase [Nemania diffusa]|nr:Quino protein amine dehydrogenase [Nemania diffusa]